MSIRLIYYRRDRSHTAVFGPSTALTLHRSVIHYRLARLRYVLDYPNYIRRKDDTDQVTDDNHQKKILRRFAPQYDRKDRRKVE